MSNHARAILIEGLGFSERVDTRTFLDNEIQDWNVGIGILLQMLDSISPMPEYIVNESEPHFLKRYTILNKTKVKLQVDEIEKELIEMTAEEMIN